MNLFNAWNYTMQKILTSSETAMVEDYLELKNFQIMFTPEDCKELLSNERVMCDYGEMKKVFFTQEENIFGHNYSKTILGPKMGKETAVEEVVSVLSKTSTTRKAVLYFLTYGNEKVPCINLIHFLVREGKLEITYFSRGQDIYRKFPCDAMCIIDYGKQVASALHLEISKVTAIITSAHIYTKDVENAKKLISDCYTKKVILTGNKKKYENYATVLAENDISLVVSFVDIPEIQSADPIKVVKNKAKYAYETFGYPVWVDDVSLVLDAYPSFPGTYTKFWFKQIGSEGLKALLNGKTTDATLYCRLCSFDGLHYHLIEGANRGYLDLNHPIEDIRMPLNSIFVGEGQMKHRDSVISKLIQWNECAYKE